MIQNLLLQLSGNLAHSLLSILFPEVDEKRCTIEAITQEEEWESVVFKFNDSKRYRRIVGSIAGSCLVAVTPLIASADAAACLTALDIVEVTFISTFY